MIKIILIVFGILVVPLLGILYLLWDHSRTIKWLRENGFYD